ncbi:MAG: serine protease, partial [Actinomycetota bacterium]|nr:serine protease [Actinomycetota bacterium]
MNTLRRTAVLLALVVVVGLVAPGPARSAPQWAPASSATVHPGVQTYTEGGQCTANFVFYDAANVYIGQAAHCSGTGGSTETDGCEAGSHPLGTPVTVRGASRPGTMVYNSWLTMQALNEEDPDACQYNDFALVRLDPADAGRVNPSIPHWGGPVGLNTTGTRLFEDVYSYGNSSLRLGLTVLSPKKGISMGDEGGGWTHLVNTFTPGVPGDSGSAFLDSRGRALGVLSTLAVGVPGGVYNGVSDLARALEYMRAHSEFTSVQLALGTV